MHPYIKHLIEDIQNAERQEKDFVAYPKPTTFEEQMQEVERYVSGEGECQLSELTGITKENFPPAQQLTEKDMEMALTAYNRMLHSWNVQVDWPQDMPITARYNFLLKFVLNHKIVPLSTGDIHLDFCTGYAPDCDWDDFCSCKEIWQDYF